jgi:phosphoglycolate phosphatase-like HAD superfamily hydrolase
MPGNNSMKLVLFDIDGTLISARGAATYELNNGTDNKFAYALKKAFGITVSLDFSKHKGSIDKRTLWLAAGANGVQKKEFDEQFPFLAEYMYEYFERQKKDLSLYKAIDEAHDLVLLLSHNPDFRIGVLTGNIPLIASWKMEQGRVRQYFNFGLYGDGADDRIELAKTVFPKAREFFGTDFKPDDITVIGDTVTDVLCGKAIGAHTIAVTDLGHDAEETIKAEKPDVLVRTLGDPRVYSYFGLPM